MCALLTLQLRAQLPFLGGTRVPVLSYVLCITLEPG